MAIRDDFFTALKKGAKWDVGVSINRTNPLPLDVNSVFDTKANLDAYVAGAFAYPGQIVALVEESATTIYYIDQAKALQEVGKIPLGDNKTITVAEDGTISLFGLAEAATGAQPVKQADGSIKWIKPDTTTVEGLTTEVNSLGNRATALEDKVGDDSKGLVKNVADLTTEVSGVKTNLADNYYDKTAVDGLVAGAFHFKGEAVAISDDNTKLYSDAEKTKEIKGKAGDVYQVGDKEYAYNGTIWVELGFSLNLTAYALKTDVSTAKTEAITEAGTNADTKIASKVGEIGNKTVKAYVDDTVASIGIGEYAKTSEVTEAINGAKTELKKYTDDAKNEAVTTAGTNADTKISTKIGEIGEGTVKSYVDGKETTINASIEAVDAKVEALGALAKKDKVAETDLADALKTKIDGKADSATTLVGYGIGDAYTKTEVDDKISSVDTKVTSNTNAIEAINNTETGILAEAKKYADGKVYNDTDIKKEIADNKANIATNTSAIEAINNEKTGILAEAKKYADSKVYDDTTVKADIKKNTDAISTLNGTGEGSVTKAVADGIAKVVAEAPEDFDTLKEIADWIANDTTGSVKMANDIAAVVGTDKDENGTPKSMRAVAEEVAKAKVEAIPTASQTIVGLIKGTDGKVNVADGQITSITTDALTQGTDTFILDGGSAAV